MTPQQSPSADLLPCPWCKAKFTVEYEDDGPDYAHGNGEWEVALFSADHKKHCPLKGAEGVAIPLDKITAQEAIKIFDTRANPSPAASEIGDDLPEGMVRIKTLIAQLQSILDRFGNTCIYIKPGVSWGAVAMNRERADKEALLAQSEEKK